ncbi:MAG TPA: prepilin-type N-terminal cleavage/methylation domain-containing protein [Longimicrobiales bacterium]|nr:prepilin-type N-terminal cleavage/methylation domain-containing protein [Longimicrobiales bacterium]
MTRRSGVSLVELMVALGLFTVLMAASLGFYRQQGKAFNEGNQRMTLMQNLRYGVHALEQNLRTAGIGVPAEQPVLVYAGTRTVAFNADYATRDANDFFAVYHEPELPASAASAVEPTRKFTIPGTSFTYPDSAYFAGGGNSPAETITFSFALDTTTARLDDFVLYRQVNDGAPEIIARHLLQTDREFLTYYVVEEGSAGSPITEIPTSNLPTAHVVPLHGSPDDFGAVARTDSIRAVRVSYAATNGLEGERERRREITRLIRLPNAGAAQQRTCGSRPLLGIVLGATGISPTESTPGHIELNWNQATDEHSGERDVVRYVIWRRPDGTTDWGDPIVSIPAGASSYSYQDFTPGAGNKFDYALAAQDCTPQYSSLSIAGPVQWTP